MSYDYVQIPAGCTVKVGDTTAGLTDIGVLKGDAQIQIQYDHVKVKGSKAETLVDLVKNMVANATFEMYQINLERVQDLLDGLATVTVTAAAIVEDYEQTIASGAYSFNEFIPCEYQNGAGTVLQIDAQGYPDLSGATDGALAHGDDYFITQNGEGVWGIIIVEAGTTVSTMDQVFTLSYDYTPAASKTLKMGASSASFTSKIVEFSKTISSKTFRCRLWSAVNKEGITLMFPDSAGDDPASIPITLEGGLDTTKTSGEQLIEIYDEIGVAS